jgi:hypothetical protein
MNNDLYRFRKTFEARVAEGDDFPEICLTPAGALGGCRERREKN